MSEKLKPCPLPWCRGKAELLDHGVKCSKCGLVAPGSPVSLKHAQQMALEKWNHRPLEQEMLEALKRAEEFIENGIEYGYIAMPDAPDPALETPNIIEKAIAKAEGKA
ncbi:hypothetical protein MXMO3_01760 [Maritalea myrionectae]|uniref:Uncharacterized protein n=1 Tax=Maritalea myrionectae TaxID=454601 RepID=A0A2R4MEB9_9HYPH|nr:hypothetical protein [Maritalea myrionectae]AVX04285.1 hypothetical protein MXMO3_01760 [Maritalea myrionectae]